MLIFDRKLNEVLNTSYLKSIINISYNLIESAPHWPEAWGADIIQDPRVKEWLKGHGVSGIIGQPMSGAVGRAYPIGDDFILKLTPHKQEATAAAILVGHTLESAVKILDVKKVKEFEKPDGSIVTIFGIIQERAKIDATKKHRIAANAVYNYLDYNPDFIGDPNKVTDEVKANYLQPKYRADKDIVNIVKKIVYSLYELQEETGILSQDTHGGNIKLNQRGEPVFFDFGRSSINFDNEATHGKRLGKV